VLKLYLPIEKGEQVHDAQERNDVEVNLVDEASLRSMGWTYDLGIVLVVAFILWRCCASEFTWLCEID
jgi:hypothetical protein